MITSNSKLSLTLLFVLFVCLLVASFYCLFFVCLFLSLFLCVFVCCLWRLWLWLLLSSSSSSLFLVLVLVLVVLLLLFREQGFIRLSTCLHMTRKWMLRCGDKWRHRCWQNKIRSFKKQFEIKQQSKQQHKSIVCYCCCY